MVDKIIREYLSGHKRLVLPEFGAFIRKDGDGTVVFVEFLRKDDDVLLSLLRQACGLDRAGAAALLERYVEAVRNGSGRPGGYVIEGMGVMRRMENGSYDLEYNPQAMRVPAEKKAPESEHIPNPAAQKEESPDVPDEVNLPEEKAPHHAPAELEIIPVPVEPGGGSADRENGIWEEAPKPAAQDTRRPNNPSPEPERRARIPVPPKKRRGGDVVLVVAIIIAIMAIIAMLYGLLFTTNPGLDLMEMLGSFIRR